MSKDSTGSVNRGRWLQEEDDRLREAHAKFGAQWGPIAQHVGRRNSDQCWKRWTECLDPDLITADWTDEADEALLAAIGEHGTSWSHIGVALGNRSRLSCKNRYDHLRRRKEREKKRASLAHVDKNTGKEDRPAKKWNVSPASSPRDVGPSNDDNGAASPDPIAETPSASSVRSRPSPRAQQDDVVLARSNFQQGPDANAQVTLTVAQLRQLLSGSRDDERKGAETVPLTRSPSQPPAAHQSPSTKPLDPIVTSDWLTSTPSCGLWNVSLGDSSNSPEVGAPNTAVVPPVAQYAVEYPVQCGNTSPLAAPWSTDTMDQSLMQLKTPSSEEAQPASFADPEAMIADPKGSPNRNVENASANADVADNLIDLDSMFGTFWPSGTGKDKKTLQELVRSADWAASSGLRAHDNSVLADVSTAEPAGENGGYSTEREHCSPQSTPNQASSDGPDGRRKQQEQQLGRSGTESPASSANNPTFNIFVFNGSPPRSRSTSLSAEKPQGQMEVGQQPVASEPIASPNHAAYSILAARGFELARALQMVINSGAAQ